MDLHFTDSTIYAPATVPGTGAISIIRVSGPACFEIVDRVVRLRKGSVGASSGYSLHFGQIFESEDRAQGTPKKMIDEVLVSVFRAPASYTGEDMVEISCHASSYIVGRICALLAENGAEAAQAGEFTRRAFINGKMDLSQAEAVADVIASSSQSAHELAIKQMKGAYSEELVRMRNELLRLVSLMELELDFSEEEVEFANREELGRLLEQSQEHTANLADSFQLGNALKNGIPTAIVGAPNSGKSTLLNALCGQERAIVSDIEGTTRDTIEETCTLDGVLFRFVDTAGIRQTQESIEQMGIERTFREMDKARVVLAMLDLGQNDDILLENARLIVEKLCESHNEFSVGSTQTPLLYFILNKCDLPYATSEKVANLTSRLLSCATQMGLQLPKENILTLSLKNEEIATDMAEKAKRGGVEELKKNLSKRMKGMAEQHNTLVTNLRHAQALKQASEALGRTRQALSDGIPTDLCCQDLREAIYHLGAIVGEISTDEVLGEIFGKFCIGK